MELREHHCRTSSYFATFNKKKKSIIYGVSRSGTTPTDTVDLA